MEILNRRREETGQEWRINMKIFDLESPFMQFLSKVADLLILNVLTMVCCIPIITIGASLTALNYMTLKIVRNEESYIIKGFFKSFKENFKQATIIWLLFLVVIAVLVGDFAIMLYSGLKFNWFIQIVITAVAVLVVFTFMFLFPALAKFENTIFRTIKNAFVMSILQFPKTILMIICYLAPPILYIYSYELAPIAFLFCLSVPAYVSALLYNKFFQKLEDQVTQSKEEENTEDEDERIFKDELDETLTGHNS